MPKQLLMCSALRKHAGKLSSVSESIVKTTTFPMSTDKPVTAARFGALEWLKSRNVRNGLYSTCGGATGSKNQILGLSQAKHRPGTLWSFQLWEDFGLIELIERRTKPNPATMTLRKSNEDKTGQVPTGATTAFDKPIRNIENTSRPTKL